jgi:ferredoxin-NADP reductase
VAVKEATVRAEVLKAWDETPALRALELAAGPSFASAHKTPGQVLKIHTSAGEGYFAVASAPGARQISLLLKRGNTVADAAIAVALPGERLEISGPMGTGFPMERAQGCDVLLFAAGSGIAPIRAVIQTLAANHETRPITLFYGQRGGDDFAYRNEQSDWERAGVKVVLCSSQPAPDKPFTGMRGRVHEVAKQTSFGGCVPAKSAAFLAGMKDMVADVKRTLVEAGLPPERIFLNF